MISTESYSPQWIESICEKFGYKDKNLLEKVIRAFVLLEMLVKAGAPITFKGGSAILLLLKDSLNRLSIDVLVNGPFILEQRDTDLLFRGSPNQRIICLHGGPPEDIIPGTVALEPLR